MVNKSPITSRWSTKAPSSEDGQQKPHRLQMVNKSSIASRWSTKAPSPPDGQQSSIAPRWILLFGKMVPKTYRCDNTKKVIL